MRTSVACRRARHRRPSHTRARIGEGQNVANGCLMRDRDRGVEGTESKSSALAAGVGRGTALLHSIRGLSRLLVGTGSIYNFASSRRGKGILCTSNPSGSRGFVVSG